MMQALIIDDEPHVRENLRLRLDPIGDVEVAGEYGTGREAIEAIRAVEPDLVFLDVQMPSLNGFDVLKRLGPSEMPFVIFVTAYDEYALKAFEVNAVDYLLKPIDEHRFEEALQRARDQYASQESKMLEARLHQIIDTLQRSEPPANVRDSASGSASGEVIPDRLIVKARGRIRFVPIADIDYVTSAGDYVELHAGDDTHLMRATMAELADRLDAGFYRIHRSTIVNLDRVSELRPTGHGEYAIFLDDGTRLKMSRTYRKCLQDALGTSL